MSKPNRTMFPESGGLSAVRDNQDVEQEVRVHPTDGGEPDHCLPRPSARAVLFVLGLFAVAFAGYSVAWRQAPLMQPDSPTYMRLARDIKHLTVSRLQERTPGYPLFLVLNSAEERPTKRLFYSSLLVHMAAIGMLAYVLNLLAMPRWLMVLFFLISLLPPYVEPAAYVLTETLSQFTIVGAFVALHLWLVRRRDIFLVWFSVAAAAAAFVRPTFQALAPFLAMCAALCVAAHWTVRMRMRRLVTSLGVAVFVSLSSLTAYAYVNYSKFGYFGTSTMGAFTISHKTVSFLEELPNQYADIRDILLKYRDSELLKPLSDHTAQMTAWRAASELRAHYGNDERKLVTRLAEANWYLIRTKPLSYLIECMKSLGIYWMPNDVVLSSGTSGRLRTFWAALQLGVIGVFMLQGVVMSGLGLMWLSLLAVKPASLPVLSPRAQLCVCAYTIGFGIILYTAVISCFFGIGSPRLRTPTELLIIATSMIGYVMWRDVRSSVMCQTQLCLRN